MSRFVRSALLLVALARAGQAEAQNAVRSLWQLSEVTLRLEVRGDERVWRYERIPAEIAAPGGTAVGATFWQGRRAGDRLIGELILYGAGCHPYPYPVVGSAKLDAAGEIVLTGADAERTGTGCTVQRRQTADLSRIRLKLIGMPERFEDEE